MRLFRSLLSVSLVCVLLFALFSVTSYATDNATFWDYYNEGFLIPSPDYPNRESLPYGENTAVYEFKKHYSNTEAEIFRIYIRRDLYSGSEVSAFNGITVVYVDNQTGTYPNFEILMASPSTIFTQSFRYNYSTGVVTYWGDVNTSPYTKELNGKVYQFGVKTGQVCNSGTIGKWAGLVAGTDPCYYGGRDLKSLLTSGILRNAPADQLPAYNTVYHLTAQTMSYPTSNDLSSKNIANSIDESTKQITSILQSESNAIQSAIWDNTTYVLEYQDWQLQELIGINEGLADTNEKLDDLNEELEQTPNKIVEGIKGLFIPTEEEMIVIKDKWELLLSDRFGALYEAGSFISDYVENFNYKGEKNSITFPTVSTSFSDTYFEFGGWEVQLIPDKFNPFMVTVKSVIAIVCTLAFIVMLRNKFNKIVGDNT